MIDSFHISLHISRLIADYLAASLSEVGQQELNDWLNQDKANQELFEKIVATHNLQESIHKFSEYDITKGRNKVEEKIKSRNRKKNIYRITRYAAAILLPIISTTLIYFFVFRYTPEPSTTNHLLPGGPKATLTLADGRIITLDNAQNGEVAQQGNASVIKKNTQLIYNASYLKSSTGNLAPAFNTLTTPHGGEYQLTLPDGSKVMLNAESSIKFPTAFVGKERRVEIKGEAYFEVTKNVKKPFIVQANNKAEVRVLGTHFNINAYDNEVMIKTTLLEGSVQVSSSLNHLVILKPGQQATLDGKGKMEVVNVDTEEAVAWKNGRFLFINQDLSTIMRNMARWYGINVIYTNTEVQKLKFNVDIRKYENFEKVKEIMELTEKLNIEINGKTVRVKSIGVK